MLDRLNALLEPGGVLTMSERGVIDGTIPTIAPHPNFRYFFLLFVFPLFFFFPLSNSGFRIKRSSVSQSFDILNAIQFAM